MISMSFWAPHWSFGLADCCKLPPVPPAAVGDAKIPVIQRVAEGCGAGRWRGPGGKCHPMFDGQGLPAGIPPRPGSQEVLAKLIRCHKQMEYDARLGWRPRRSGCAFASLRLPRPSQFCESASFVGKAGLGEIAPKPSRPGTPSRSPGSRQRIDDSGMLKRRYRRCSSGGSSSSSSGVSNPSLSALLRSLSGSAFGRCSIVLAAASSSGSLPMFAAMRLASSRVRLIARQAVRRGDYVGNRGKSGSARLALETTFMTHNGRAATQWSSVPTALGLGVGQDAR